MNDQLGAIFSTPAMLAAFSPAAHVAQMLRFEAALAQTQARAGLIPPDAAAQIAAACQIERYDVTQLYQEAATAGTVAIPLVRLLGEQAGAAGKYVHWGATSQDAADTALMLQMREGLDLLIADLLAVCANCARLAEQHRATLMPARTLLQQALPLTFGLKAARWLNLTTRQVTALREARHNSLALQFGGAAGTLAALGDSGLTLSAALATALDLPLPDLPWHAERDRVATITATLGVAAGAIGKIAGDIVLLAQTEVGEASEGAAPGKGVSSALPQKRNPVDAVMARAAARQAIAQVPLIMGAMDAEHERAAGGWQAEWLAIPTLFCAVAGAVARLKSALTNLQIDPARMSANLEMSNGLIMSEAVTMALAPHLGRPEAQRLVKAAAERVAPGLTFRAALLQDNAIRAALSPDQIARALDPAAYLGSANALISAALAAYRAIAP